MVCRPCHLGGLGVVDLLVRNLALLSKWGWRYATCLSSLWRRLIVTKFGKGVPWWRFNVVRSRLMSPIWKGIVASVSSSKVGQHMEVSNFVWMVGQGSLVFFWLDPWCVAEPDVSLGYSLWRLIRCPGWLIMLVGGHLITIGGWDLCSLVLPFVLRDVEDSLVWKSDVSGQFSVKVLTSWLMKDLVKDNALGVCFVWKLLVPPKVQAFLWFVCLGRLSTVAFLLTQVVAFAAGQGLCVWCSKAEDKTDHILFSCGQLPRLRFYGRFGWLVMTEVFRLDSY
ncbi:hypothetical protein GQ457_13G018320 [Hibiscus cannabinus]